MPKSPNSRPLLVGEEIEDRERAEALHIHKPGFFATIGLCLMWAWLKITR